VTKESLNKKPKHPTSDKMKRLKLERGKEELISTGGNYLCGHILRESANRWHSRDIKEHTTPGFDFL
jgi:hypothetical protein